MRLWILGLFFLISLPMNLLAQLASTPLSPPTNPVAPATPADRSSAFAPLLPFQSAQNAGPIPVEITSAETRFEGGIAIAEKDVVVRYADVTIYCDYAEYNSDTHDIFLKGNVRFYRERYAFTADRAVYNTQTKELKMADFGGPKLPFQVLGDDLVSVTENQYTIFKGYITTSDSSKPDYQL